MNIFPLLLYVASAVAYVIHFARRSPKVGHFATTSLAAAALGVREVQLPDAFTAGGALDEHSTSLMIGANCAASGKLRRSVVIDGVFLLAHRTVVVSQQEAKEAD